jgi:glycerol-3-phosphate dehydrogenase
VRAYRAALSERLKPLGLGAPRAEYLTGNYGRQSDHIVEGMRAHDDASDAETRLARAEAAFCLENEMTCTLLDFFERRTGRLYFDLPGIEAVAEPVALVFQGALRWSEEKRREELALLRLAMRMAGDFEAALPARFDRPAPR